MSLISSSPSEPDFRTLLYFGEVLDAADAGMPNISARQYTAAARGAKSFLARHWGHPLLPTQCMRAAYLQDLFTAMGLHKRRQEVAYRLRQRRKTAGPL